CLPVPLSTLHDQLYGCPRMTRGQGGSLLLSCKTLSFSTPCRFIPALSASIPISKGKALDKPYRLRSSDFCSPAAASASLSKPAAGPDTSGRGVSMNRPDTSTAAASPTTTSRETTVCSTIRKSKHALRPHSRPPDRKDQHRGPHQCGRV